MSAWVIVVDTYRDLTNAESPHKILLTRDYLAKPDLFEGRTKVINLSRSYSYQSEGYFTSLLAEARGHRVLPSVMAMLELSREQLYSHALPELEDELTRALSKLPDVTSEPFKVLICFGLSLDPTFKGFARHVFDWFPCPIVEVEASPPVNGRGARIRRLRARAVHKLQGEDRAFFLNALNAHARREWRSPRARQTPKYSLAVLHDPEETLPPSRAESLRHLASVAERMAVEVEPVTRRDLARLAEFDGLFIRETTSIDNHTYRFARRAQQEGMPVIDDPQSMIRCTNKVYLKEILEAAKIPAPRTRMISAKDKLQESIDVLQLPIVVKAPDSSFSRGVHKADTAEELKEITERLFKDSDLLLLQEFMPTDFDWRVGVLGGSALFACKYEMARKHWQVVRYDSLGRASSGAVRAVALSEAPAEVLDVAVRAANLIGDGLYGVDLKESDGKVYVIEINDNPDLDKGFEDAADKDEVWRRLVQWFIDRMA
jgi:glutathione synthase/RimK-type ligase-like ATP-grasp enzyme